MDPQDNPLDASEPPAVISVRCADAPSCPLVTLAVAGGAGSLAHVVARLQDAGYSVVEETPPLAIGLPTRSLKEGAAFERKLASLASQGSIGALAMAQVVDDPFVPPRSATHGRSDPFQQSKRRHEQLAASALRARSRRR